jgi:hypothetical protein
MENLEIEYVVYNIDEKIIFQDSDVNKFINFVRRISIENGDEDMSITCLSEAKDYLREYCDNLTLVNLDTEFLSLELEFDCPVDRTKYDLGGVYIEREGRKYALDIVGSTQSEDGYTISCKLALDFETFPIGDDYPYNLPDEFLTKNSSLIITAYIGCDFDEAPESVTLYVKRGGCTIALDASYE